MRVRNGQLVRLGGLAALLLLYFATGQSQSQSKKTVDAEDQIEPQPLAPPPTTAAEKAIRDKVGEHFSPSTGRPSQRRPLDEPPLPGDPPRAPSNMYDLRGMPALPFEEASIAILGQVLKAQPYLTPNRLNLYTEFSISVEEVFSAKPGFAVQKGDVALAVREGGTARMPDGRVVKIEPIGIGKPLRAGGRYVVFLLANPLALRYEIMMAWELRSGHVLPTFTPTNLEDIAALTAKDEESFLATVRAAARWQAGRPAEDDSVLPPKRLAPPPASASEKAQRDAIDRSYNKGGPPLDKEPPPGGIVAMSIDQAYLLSPLPFAESSIVILGTAMDYQPFLSGDKGSVYTEITVKVEEVFQARTGPNVRKGDTITVSRMGGSFQLPDGRVVSSIVEGFGKPLHLNRSYVLFLRLQPSLPRYGVVTAWELRDGRVLPANVKCGPEEWAGLTALSADQFLERVRSESYER